MPNFIAETTDLLARTPRLLTALLRGLPSDWTDTPDIDGGWRARDVVGHLITGEVTNWVPRTEHLLAEEPSVPFKPFDRFEHANRDVGVGLDQLLDRFAELRAQNLARIQVIVTEDDLDKRALHPTLGTVTLRELLATWAVHDLDHVSQIFAGLAGSRDAEVGPWKVNLGILLRRHDPAAVPR